MFAVGAAGALRGIALSLLVGAVPVALGCSPANSAVPEADPVRPAKLFEVQASDRAQASAFPGAVRAADEVELSFRVSGPLASIAVEDGQAVKKGELLARIDARDFRLRVGAAQARLDGSTARYENAGTEEKRVRGMVESKVMPTAQLDSVEGAHRVAAADVRGARQALQAARLALSDTKLKAPFEGRIAAVRVEKHQWINATQPVLLLRSEGRLEVGIDVPESKLPAVLSAPAGSLKVRFPSLGDTLHPARVVSHQTEVDRLTKTYEVSLALEEPVAEASPGMTAEAVWTQTSDVTGFVVPLASVGTTPEGETFVYRYADGLLHNQPVELGPPSDAGVVVTAGVSEGDVLLAAGVRTATDGQRVRPIAQEDLGG